VTVTLPDDIVVTDQQFDALKAHDYHPQGGEWPSEKAKEMAQAFADANAAEAEAEPEAEEKPAKKTASK